MPAFGPIGRADLIRALRRAGYTGPFPGGRHSFMVRGHHRLIIPNPHRGTIGVQLLGDLLRKAGLSRQDWEAL
jgi:hypothetical protein